MRTQTVKTFNERLADKQHLAAMEEGKAVFLETYQAAFPEEQKRMMAALDAGDFKGYMDTVHAVLVRLAMKEFNKGGGG